MTDRATTCFVETACCGLWTPTAHAFILSWMHFFHYFVRLPRLLFRGTMILWMRLYFTSHWKRRQWSGDCTGRHHWHEFTYEIQMRTRVHAATQYVPRPITIVSDQCRLVAADWLFWITSSSPGLRRMPKWQSFSATTSARTGGGRQHWKMPFLCWENSGSSILQPSSFWQVPLRMLLRQVENRPDTLKKNTCSFISKCHLLVKDLAFRINWAKYCSFFFHLFHSWSGAVIDVVNITETIITRQVSVQCL